MADTYQSLADDFRNHKLTKDQYEQRLKILTNQNKKQAEYQEFKDDLKSIGKAGIGSALMGVGSFLPSAIGGATFGAGDAIANDRNIAKEAAAGAVAGAIIPKAVSSAAKATGADKMLSKFANSAVGKVLNTDVTKLGKSTPVINQAHITEQIKPKTEVNIPSIQSGKTTKQVANSSIKKSLGGDNIKNNPMDEITNLKAYQTMVENDMLPKHKSTNIPSIDKQAIRQAEIDKLAKREADLQQIRDAVNSIDTGEPNVDLNLINMEDLLPKSDNISVYDYFSKVNPEAYSRAEYSPYTTSYLVDQYAKGAGISPEEALNIYKNNTNPVWSLDQASGVFIPSGDNGFIRILNPEAYKWSKFNIPKDPTYSGVTSGDESLLNTIIHEDAHKLMVDLNAKLAKGEITPEGASFLMRYNGLTPQGAKSESISHAAGSIPLEGNLKIPEGRIKSYNEAQPFSEFSNESFGNQRNMLSNEIRQRAIDNEFGLINKEFESSVDKYLNGLGVNRFGGTTW